MELIEKTLIDYINDVDSPLAAPGGGSVASLVGALGVSLAKMSAHLTVNKKKFQEYEQAKKNKYILAFKELDYYKDLLVKGVDDDAISYEAVMMAYKSKDEKNIQSALNTSALIAFEMQKAAYEALTFLGKLIELGNKNLYSDLISGAILLNSCVEMASLNVTANANLLKDEEAKNKYLLDSKLLINKAKRLKNKVINDINKH